MKIDKNFVGLQQLENGMYFYDGDITSEGDIIIKLDNSLKVNGCLIAEMDIVAEKDIIAEDIIAEDILSGGNIRAANIVAKKNIKALEKIIAENIIAVKEIRAGKNIEAQVDILAENIVGWDKNIANMIVADEVIERRDTARKARKEGLIKEKQNIKKEKTESKCLNCNLKSSKVNKKEVGIKFWELMESSNCTPCCKVYNYFTQDKKNLTAKCSEHNCGSMSCIELITFMINKDN